MKQARLTCILFFFLVQGIAHANIIGPAEVQKLYALVKSSLDSTIPVEPYYLEGEKVKNIESGEAAYYLPLGVEKVANFLSSLENWCEIMSLHINVKACTYSEKNSAMTVYMGRKFYQDPEEAYGLTYEFKTIRNEEYFAVVAVAKDGPLRTSDYHIEVEIISIDNNQSFGRIYVSNRRSWISSTAMNLYLATKGRNKKGIRVVDHDDGGNPIYSSGEAGVAERNLLRYYFAFTAFFNEIEEIDPDKRHEKQLAYWFDQTERYPQLYEMSREDYISGKRRERVNQLALQQSQQQIIEAPTERSAVFKPVSSHK